ncbi:MAG: hypothetical protein IKF97_00095 [Clostridia bacterium]|nr:hypothetical protein [Clostridia bacterium]
MANSKLIVVEGAQGAGKTTITDYIRHTLKYTNLYRLSGTADSTPTGLQKSKEMYTDLLEYIKKLENKSINLLFDRTFFTEENYCRLGKKQYTFTEVYNKLLEEFSRLDFEIYYITLYLEDTAQYQKRLIRDEKAKIDYSKFGVENSIQQQKIYLEMAKEIKEKYPQIKTIEIKNDNDIEITKKTLREFIEY